MTTFSLPLEQVDAARLEALKAAGVTEGRQLEFKAELPGTSDDEKREFLADVSSFANAAGGDLIYGIRALRDAQNRATGEIDSIVGVAGLNLDATRLRLDAGIRDGIDPRMPPVTFQEIRRGTDPPCLVLRIPRSWAGPHMVTFKNLSRFFSRNSAGKYQLDVHEIRASFLATETAHDRLRRFRIDRVTQVLALETPVPMATGPKLILHALPLDAREDVWSRVIALKEGERVNAVPVIGASAVSWRYNLDGFMIHTDFKDLATQCYTQLFRSAGIEAVSGRLLVKAERDGFYPWGMEGRVIGALSSYQKFYEMIGVAAPLMVGLTLSGIKGWSVLRGDSFGETFGVFDRDVIVIPEVLVSDLAIPADLVLRPLFDTIWNGGGWPGSPNYDKDGRWVKPR